MQDSFTVVTLAERADLFEAADTMCGAEWPEFMLHDPVANDNWMTFIEAYPEFQLLILHGDDIAAVVNTIPLRFDGPAETLPDDGWDWGVLKAVEDLRAGLKPNALFGVQIVVNSAYQGKGLSSFATKQMLSLIHTHSLERLVIAVRPNRKCDYPLVSIDDYLTWKNADGHSFDSWLRVHEKCGGRIVKVCPKAMLIEGSIDEWETWTGKRFPGTGLHIVPGALSPVAMDRERNRGTYIEPNVWVVYEGSKRL